MAPLATVITPTFRRHCVLIERCMPSVAAQAYPLIEHIIVSDGPDERLERLIASLHAPHVRYASTPVRSGHWGHAARLLGLEMARGDVIAWLDDDDAYRPDHLALAVAALKCDKAVWGHGRMLVGAHYRHAQRSRDDPVACAGEDPFDYRQVMTSMIFSRREAFETATWGTGTQNPDGDLVKAWHEAGLPHTILPVVTADMFTSRPVCASC